MKKWLSFRAWSIGVTSSDVLLTALALWLMFWYRPSGPVQVVVRIGSTEYQRFTVAPTCAVVTVRGVWGPEFREDCGWSWSTMYGSRSVVVVTNRLGG